jgi:integrase
VQRYKERAPEIRFLTLPQIDEQLNALDGRPDLQAMVATLIFAGLRREEMLWLTLDDLDLQAPPNGLLRIRAKTVEGGSWQPKTQINRAVPVSRTLRMHLDCHRRRITPGHWLFPSPNGTKWDPDNFSRDLRAINKTAKLPWGCLDYRHTFGSQLAMKGESLYKISKLMGNSPEICRRHYAALLPESLTDTVEFALPTREIRMLEQA